MRKGTRKSLTKKRSILRMQFLSCWSTCIHDICQRLCHRYIRTVPGKWTSGCIHHQMYCGIYISDIRALHVSLIFSITCFLLTMSSHIIGTLHWVMVGREASSASLALVLDFLPRFCWGCTGSSYEQKAHMSPKLIELGQSETWSISWSDIGKRLESRK